ncbi:MAG: hypothetical protein L0271_17095, partial [Gemmatimonadetes bacterium]|nr:hypothetical protein [Gemmatimonadota bacterium]
GDDWFALPEKARLTWPEIVDVVEEQQRRLIATVTDVAEGRVPTPLSDSARFDLILGITCHAVYHAGQIQLIKRLLTG